jgi:hypothetical protein
MEILTIIRWITFAVLTALWLFIAIFNTYFSFRKTFFRNGKYPSSISLIGSIAAGSAIWALPIESSHIRQLSILIAIFFADGIWIIFTIYRRLFLPPKK